MPEENSPILDPEIQQRYAAMTSSYILSDWIQKMNWRFLNLNLISRVSQNGNINCILRTVFRGNSSAKRHVSGSVLLERIPDAL